jgi:hypothetical protein
MGIKMSVKKLGLLFGLLGVFTGIFAGDDNSCRKESKDKKLQDCSSLCFAGPYLEEDNSFNVMGAAIYGVANAQGSEVSLYTSNSSLTPQGEIIEPYEEPSWGFKVGLGYRFSHDNWNLEGQYTWFKSTYSTNLNQGFGNLYTPMGYGVSVVNDYPYYFQNMEYGTYTMLQDLVVYLYRPTLYTALLEISPYFGLDYINTIRRLTISLSNDISNSIIYQGFYREYDKMQFWGVGPMAGISSNWYLGYDLGIYADGYFAVTYGCSRYYSQTYINRQILGGQDPLNATISNTLYQYAPHMTFELGFNWSHTFNDERAALSFKAGYESQYFFNVVNRWQTSIYPIQAANLGIGLQNLVLQLQLDF